MAVEALGIDPFPSQIVANSDFIAKTPTRLYTSQADDFIPLSVTETPDPISPPKRRRRLQQLRVVPEIFAVNLFGKADSGSSSNCSAAAFSVPGNHHKRSRDAIADDQLPVNPNSHKISKVSPFQIPGHQLEIDRLISKYMQSFARKLKEKDDEIRKLGKLNCQLQEKVKSLAMENQMWRGLAQDNEAEADSLRSNLQHALARGGGGVDDAESGCGSNNLGTAGADCEDAAAESRSWWIWCGACGGMKSAASLQLCRHLCLCAACVPAATTAPPA